MDIKIFLELSTKYTAIPVYKRLLADVLTPVSLFMNLRTGAERPFLLESVEGGEQVARYSFLGRNPYQKLEFDGINTTLTKDGKTEKIANSYFTALENLTNAYTEPIIPDLPRLTGGAVGFSA